VDAEPVFDSSRRAPATLFDSWRRHTASGVVLTAIALGLREALEEPSEEVAIVQDAPDPFGPPEQPIELHLEWGSPEDTWVVVRPWLLRGDR
jgi:hypothetical protein